MNQSILIGPAGWHYADWNGVVYPLHPPKDFRELAYLAEYFNTVEINVSFYRMLTIPMVIKWVKQVADKPVFQFAVKLHQQFTHDRGPIDKRQAFAFMETLKPMRECNKLAAVLAQFPWSFKKSKETLTYLRDLAQSFSSQPLHFEFRHLSWLDEETLAVCRETGAGIVNIDQPVIGQSLPPTAMSCSSVAYVRLHGRNYQNWFREGAGRDARYDYRYNPQELSEWAERIHQLVEKAQKTIIIFNNHFKGQAVLNSLQLMSMLLKTPVKIPPTLLQAYPELKTIQKTPSGQASFDF